MNKSFSKIYIGILASMLLVGMFANNFAIEVSAKEQKMNVQGTLYSFGEKDKYVLDDALSTTSVTAGTAYGSLCLNGDATGSTVNGYNDFIVNSGHLSFSYVIKQDLLNAEETAWHLEDDKTKAIDNITLDDNIMSGALIVQSSFDGKKWVTDNVWTDLLGKKSTYTPDIYTTNDIQLTNGCYYRIIVAYKEAKQIEAGAFLKAAKYDYAKYAEVYTFYAIYGDEVNRKNTSPAGTPRRQFIDKELVVNTGKDNGYDFAQGKALDKDDPHFTWSLGTFTVNGFTRETTESNGNIVFLKTVGDDVTLWFTLDQDIDALNGNSNLVISEDKNGYDKNYQINNTDFKHGILIVKYTDEEGNIHEPVKYTDFLLASTRTGANTKVILYEEGEYEVALDYEIKNTPRKIGSLEVVPEYTNYKMTFKFSIRNGNTMVFPKDLKTGSELKNEQMTENGFSVDLAKSKYLTIDVVRETVNVNEDGTIKLDVRANTVGKDSGEYRQEGKYTITVKNQYSNNEPTSKIIYVGNNKYLKALATGNMSLEKLNEKISEGYTVEEDGSLTAPPEPEPEPIEEPEEKDEVQDIVAENNEEISTSVDTEKNNIAVSQEPVSMGNNTDNFVEQDVVEEVETEEIANSTNPIRLIIISCIAIVALVVLAIGMKKKGAGQK